MGWIVGAVINVIGSIMINLGTNITKLGHNKTAAAAPLEPPPISKHPRQWFRFPGKKWFFLGMSIFAVGNVLNFASFGFAAQSLLAALGVVQFLSNMVFARVLNNELITKRVMFATALVVAGCILLVCFGNHESPIMTGHELLKLYSKGPYIAYLVVMAVTVVTAYLVYRHGKNAIGGLKVQRVIQGPWARWLPVCYALFSGLLGTQSVLYGKTLSMLLRTTINGNSQLGFWYTWLSLVVFIFFAAFWLTRYSKALRLFPVTLIMPILQIVWVLFSIVSGSLYYQEYQTLNALSGSMFGLGVVILLIGIAFLTGGKREGQPPEHVEAELEEELVAQPGASLDTTPTSGKLLAESPPLQDSLQQEAPSAAAVGLPTHGKRASDDVGLRLFSGELSSATLWDAAMAQEAGEASQQAVGRAGKKLPALRVVVEAGAGEEVAASIASSDKTSILEEHDMDTNFRQFAMGFAGLDHLNPLSPAFTSFSMPLVPAVSTTPRVAGGRSLSMSARGTRRSSGSAPPPGKHKIQRSRSAGELEKIMEMTAALEAGEAAPETGRSTPPRELTSPAHPPHHSHSMATMRGTPFSVAPQETPAAVAVTPESTPATHKGRAFGGSAPRAGTLGSGGSRRSRSMMSERATPVSLPFSPSSAHSNADPGDAVPTSSSIKPSRVNPLSPRVFLEPLSPHSEEQATQDLNVVLNAQKGKHD